MHDSDYDNAMLNHTNHRHFYHIITFFVFFLWKIKIIVLLIAP
jgi:hypothetical protein